MDCAQHAHHLTLH
jgi:hypothetical protein